MRCLLALFLFSAGFLGATIVPSTRLVTWQGNVGVSGGIPTGQTIYTTLSPRGGTLDDAGAINTALAACPTGQVVLLGAGTFRINSSSTVIDFQGVGNSKVLRGSGTTNTFINTFSGGYIELRGTFVDPSGAGATRSAFTSSAAKGDTTFTLASASWVNVGDSIVVSQLDDTAFVNRKDEDNADTFSYIYAGNRGFSQMVKVTGKSTNTLTIDVPLGAAFTTTLTAQACQVASNWISGCGIEDLTINPQYTDGSTNTIHIQEAQNCWVKNVLINNVNRTGVIVDFGYRIEVRHCYFNGSNVHGAGQGYGVALYNTTASCLVEDNILVGMHLGFSADYGTFGNVFGYNYEALGIADSSQAPAGGTHGYHSWMNLWEGNFFNDKLSLDNTHGSGSSHTALRNRIMGYNATYSYDTTAIHGAAWNRQSNFVGNILGTTSVHTVAYSYYPTAFDFSTSKVCFRWGDDDDSARNVGDDQTTADLIVQGNFDTVSASVTWTITPEAIPNSYYLSGKPANFGFLAWPVYTSSEGNSATLNEIPAGYRYSHGVDPPANGTGSGPTGTTSLTGTSSLK